jgi:hypothetical protein
MTLFGRWEAAPRRAMLLTITRYTGRSMFSISFTGLSEVAQKGRLRTWNTRRRLDWTLIPGQQERLHPKLRLLAYEAAVGTGGMLVGRLVTRELLLKLFRKAGVKFELGSDPFFIHHFSGSARIQTGQTPFCYPGLWGARVL